MDNAIKINLDNLTEEQIITIIRILYTAGTVEDVKKVDTYLSKFLNKERRKTNV